MGDIMGDLNSRRGRVLGMESEGKNQIINAQVPMAEFQTYAPDLRSMTGGRGIYRHGVFPLRRGARPHRPENHRGGGEGQGVGSAGMTKSGWHSREGE
jgi:predicted membrane GTPase involved in stress response